MNNLSENNHYIQINEKVSKNKDNVEIFLKNIYSYFYKKGYWNIIVGQIVDIIGLIFTLIFSIVIFMFLDWGNIIKCSMKKENCDNIINTETWRLNGFYLLFVSIYIAIISLILIGSFVKFFTNMKKFKQIRKFYRDILKLQDKDLVCTDWKFIIDKLLENQLYFNKKNNLNPSTVLNIIMRKENYLIALIESEILPLKIRNNVILTKMTEWIIYSSIINTIHDIDINENDFNTKKKLENILLKRLKLTGIICVIISPFLLIFMFVYILLIYGNKYHSNSSDSYRQWNKYSLCKFREYNELPHLFEERIVRSIKYSHNYIISFETGSSTKLLKLISFMVSSMLVTLLGLGFLNEDIMTVHIGNRAIAWYVVFLGIILTIVKLFDFDQYNSKPKDKILFKIKEFTRFIPKKWEENPKSYDTYQEFTKWFQSIIEIYLIELISVLISPLILIYKYKKVAKDVSEFVFQNTFRSK